MNLKIDKWFVYIISLFLLISCNSQNTIKQETDTSLQIIVNEVSKLYFSARNDRSLGMSEDSIITKYQNRISFYHGILNKSLDSIYIALTEHKLSEEKYNQLINSIQMDSLRRNVYQLEKAGVTIPILSMDTLKRSKS